jgi:hypothetical protein
MKDGIGAKVGDLKELGAVYKAKTHTHIWPIWLRIETGGGQFKRRNEPSVSIKCGEFLN